MAKACLTASGTRGRVTTCGALGDAGLSRATLDSGLFRAGDESRGFEGIGQVAHATDELAVVRGLSSTGCKGFQVPSDMAFKHRS